MPNTFLLASSSEIRATLLRQAGIEPQIVPARIDEDLIRRSLLAEAVSPRDMSDALAEAKARKVAGRLPEGYVLGCDQIAALGDQVLVKPETPEMAEEQLALLSGRTHRLYSAAVLYLHGEPVWRHIGTVEMEMRRLSPAYIPAYVGRNWDSIRHAVGCYKLEEEGVRLFSAVRGDYFHVLGLPLIELLSYLTGRGELDI